MNVRFVHDDPHGNARDELAALLGKASGSAQMAFCFFRAPGRELLRRYISVLRRSASFVVISCEWPTDLDQVAKLHEVLPGRVFIHLGWATPQEKKVGSALMHSKVCLVEGASGYKGLWVGSHNLTANALGGANLEAALVCESDGDAQVFASARAHLEACREDAEMFNPDRLEFYKSLQRPQSEPIGLKDSVLCVHAEAHANVALPAVIHMRFDTTEYDDITKTDTPVHFFVHPPGYLSGGTSITAETRLFFGKIVDDNRTERHPGGGATSSLREATHWLEIVGVPRVVEVGASSIRPVTQAAVRLDQQGRPDEFLYSVKGSRSRAEAFAFEGHGRPSETSVPADIRRFFSPDSFRGDRFYFTPREHLVERTSINVYADTPIPPRFDARREHGDHPRVVDGAGALDAVRPREAPMRDRRGVRVDVKPVHVARPTDAFIFRSRFRVPADDERLE